MPVLEAPLTSHEIKLAERLQPPQFEEFQPDDGFQAALERLATLDLPAEDGIPLESNWHRLQMNLLLDTIHYHWRDRNDYFAGGNMFIYYNLVQAKRREYRGPDVFIVKDVDGTQDRQSWVVWEENGRYPDVIVELASRSTIDVDLHVKKPLYERTFRTPEYFCYDPLTTHLYGWKHNGRRYVAISPNEQGWLWSEEMELWLGVWEGTFQRLETQWLRFYTQEGQLVPTLVEAEAQRAQVEAQRANTAETENERLRALLKQHEIQA